MVLSLPSNHRSLLARVAPRMRSGLACAVTAVLLVVVLAMTAACGRETGEPPLVSKGDARCGWTVYGPASIHGIPLDFNAGQCTLVVGVVELHWVEEVTKAHPDSRVHCYLDQFADFRGCRASISLPRESIQLKPAFLNRRVGGFLRPDRETSLYGQNGKVSCASERESHRQNDGATSVTMKRTMKYPRDNRV